MSFRSNRHVGRHVHGAHAPRAHIHAVAHAALRRRAMTAVGFGQSGEQLVQRVEAEIMQHQQPPADRRAAFVVSVGLLRQHGLLPDHLRSIGRDGFRLALRPDRQPVQA